MRSARLRLALNGLQVLIYSKWSLASSILNLNSFNLRLIVLIIFPCCPAHSCELLMHSRGNMNYIFSFPFTHWSKGSFWLYLFHIWIKLLVYKGFSFRDLLCRYLRSFKLLYGIQIERYIHFLWALEDWGFRLLLFIRERSFWCWQLLVYIFSLGWLKNRQIIFLNRPPYLWTLAHQVFLIISSYQCLINYFTIIILLALFFTPVVNINMMILLFLILALINLRSTTLGLS